MSSWNPPSFLIKFLADLRICRLLAWVAERRQWRVSRVRHREESCSSSHLGKCHHCCRGCLQQCSAFSSGKTFKYDPIFILLTRLWSRPSVAADHEDDGKEEEEDAEHHQADDEDQVDIDVWSLPLLDISAGESLDHVAVGGVLWQQRRADFLNPDAAGPEVLRGVRVERDVPHLEADVGDVVPGLDLGHGAQLGPAGPAGGGGDLERVLPVHQTRGQLPLDDQRVQGGLLGEEDQSLHPLTEHGSRFLQLLLSLQVTFGHVAFPPLLGQHHSVCVDLEGAPVELAALHGAGGVLHLVPDERELALTGHSLAKECHGVLLLKHDWSLCNRRYQYLESLSGSAHLRRLGSILRHKARRRVSAQSEYGV